MQKNTLNILRKTNKKGVTLVELIAVTGLLLIVISGIILFLTLFKKLSSKPVPRRKFNKMSALC